MDGLDDAEHSFQIGEIFFLRASRRSYNKGVDNLSPPFGKFRIAAKRLFHFAKNETIWEVRGGQFDPLTK